MGDPKKHHVESLSLSFLQSSWVHKIHTKEKTNYTGGIDNWQKKRLLGPSVIVVVQSLSHVTPWTASRQASLSFTISQSWLKLMSIESVMPTNHLILCRPLLLHSVFPSIRVFSNESALRIKCPKYWSFNFSISPSSEYSGLISLKIDWFDLLAVWGTGKNLLQHHNSKA